MPLRQAYDVCMANKKASSAPLFGRPTGRQVKDVQDEIDAYTARLIQNHQKARQILERTAPEAAPDEPAAPADNQ